MKLTFALVVSLLTAQPVLAQADEIVLHQGFVPALAVSSDGKLATAGWSKDPKAEIILWEMATGKRLARMEGHPSEVKQVAFASSGKLLATTCKDYLMIWEVPTGKLLSKTAGAAFLGKHGVGRIHDAGIDLADLDPKKPARTWRNASPIKRHVLSADGEQLAVITGADGRKVVILNLATMEERISFTNAGRGTDVECLAFSPDKHLLAIGEWNDLRLWNLSTGKLHGVLADG
jgi:WD40 repeat protein